MFPQGATAPTLSFDLRSLPASGIQSTLLKVDAQSLSNNDPKKQFTWSAQTASTGQSDRQQPAAELHRHLGYLRAVQQGARAEEATGTYELGFPLEVANTPVKAPDGTPLVVRYELSGPGADVLAPGALASLRCVGNGSALVVGAYEAGTKLL